MNNTESYIYYLYENINVLSNDHLSIDNISRIFNFEIIYWEYSSELVYFKEKYKMFINESLTEQQQWQDFGHEMCHFCWHGGANKYLHEMYVEYQENKADYFMYHFCVPSFMLQQLKGVTAYDIMNLFNVEFDFALRRLEMYRNNLMQIAESKITYR